jgi:hypothetical protein
MNDLRKEYRAKFGKKPGPQWSDQEIRQRIDNQPEYNVEQQTEPLKTEVPKEEETITMTKVQFREMLKEAQDEMRKEQKQMRRLSPNEWEEMKDEKPIRKAHLKVYHDEDGERGVIIDLKRAPYAKFLAHKANRDLPPEKRDLYEITILFDSGEKKTIDMALHDVSLINELEKVDIIETKARRLVKKLGKIRRAPKNKEGYIMSTGIDLDLDHIELGEWVDEQVTRMEETHVIRRPSGQVMELPNNRLNL